MLWAGFLKVKRCNSQASFWHRVVLELSSRPSSARSKPTLFPLPFQRPPTSITAKAHQRTAPNGHSERSKPTPSLPRRSRLAQSRNLPHGPENPQRPKKTTRRLACLGRASRPAPMLPKNLQRQHPSHNTRYLPLPSPRLLKHSPSHHQPRPRIFRACLPCQVYLQSVQPYGPVQSFPDLPSLAFRSSVAPAHHAHGNRVSTPLRPGPYTALMP